MTLLTRQTIIFKSRSMASELSASKHQQRRRQNSLPETTRPASTAAVEMQKTSSSFGYQLRLHQMKNPFAQEVATA